MLTNLISTSTHYLTLFILVFFIFVMCDNKPPHEKWLTHPSPDSFKAKFETTKGDFIAEFTRSYSPLAVDRIYQLIQSGFYQDIAIYRVVDNFVAQFGLSQDTTLNTFWKNHIIPDEEVKAKNVENTIAYARLGPNSRSTILYINLTNNSPRLDNIDYNGVKGFPVIGKIIEGEDVPKRFYSKYENQPSVDTNDSLTTHRNIYLKRKYPYLDYIKKVSIVN